MQTAGEGGCCATAALAVSTTSATSYMAPAPIPTITADSKGPLSREWSGGFHSRLRNALGRVLEHLQSSPQEIRLARLGWRFVFVHSPPVVLHVKQVPRLHQGYNFIHRCRVPCTMRTEKRRAFCWSRSGKFEAALSCQRMAAQPLRLHALKTGI